MATMSNMTNMPAIMNNMNTMNTMNNMSNMSNMSTNPNTLLSQYLSHNNPLVSSTNSSSSHPNANVDKAMTNALSNNLNTINDIPEEELPLPKFADVFAFAMKLSNKQLGKRGAFGSNYKSGGNHHPVYDNSAYKRSKTELTEETSG